MIKKPSGLLSWDIKKIAEALKINIEEVKEYFTDGRRVSFVLERRIAREVLKGGRATSEGAGYDVEDTNGGRWEVRSITKAGIYFCPSYMVGSGRSFNRAGFVGKLEKLKGYIVADVTEFPVIPFWIIEKEIILKWWKQKKLGKTTKVSKEKALNLIKEIKDKN